MKEESPVENHEEELARMRAANDQIRANMRDLAEMVWAFYSELVERGFERSQALDLCSTWLAEVIQVQGSGDE